MSLLETDDRLISPSAPAGKREEAIDRAIRPTRLDDYIGQPQVRTQMEIFIHAARYFWPTRLGQNHTGQHHRP